MPPQNLTARNLLDALDANQFVLYGQAIVRLRPAQPDLRDLEILVRLLEEEQKLLPPGSFLPVLEEAGLMPLLDRWVVREVLRWMVKQRERWPDEALPRCSVNLSEPTLRDRRFAGFVEHELGARTVMPDKLSFEVSLDHIRRHRQAFIDLASRLKPLGCPILVSGFGAGTTALPGLHRLGVRVVKIDGALIRALDHKPAALQRLHTITDACIGLGIHSVAEMVEDPDTLAVLRDAGVDYAQGFAVGLPIPLAQLA